MEEILKKLLHEKYQLLEDYYHQIDDPYYMGYLQNHLPELLTDIQQAFPTGLEELEMKCRGLLKGAEEYFNKYYYIVPSNPSKQIQFFSDDDVDSDDFFNNI